ncbi:MAG TPA: ribonuclease HII [Gammaproteobacteria bacterium]|nr:ribonuclease HII [Gammaproteobacteria bacterium]
MADTIVAGVDEAGRGPWAGPVVAAAVMLPLNFSWSGLTDSKKMTKKRRDIARNVITQESIAWSIAWSTAEEIDTMNILAATLLAMKRAVQGLWVKPKEVLVDGHMLPDWDYSSKAIIQGDLHCLQISAASVLAKTFRDDLLHVYDHVYPGYGFANHKGYGTKEHQQALQKLGPCKAHRKSFAPVRRCLEVMACN